MTTHESTVPTLAHVLRVSKWLCMRYDRTLSGYRACSESDIHQATGVRLEHVHGAVKRTLAQQTIERPRGWFAYRPKYEGVHCKNNILRLLHTGNYSVYQEDVASCYPQAQQDIDQLLAQRAVHRELRGKQGTNQPVLLFSGARGDAAGASEVMRAHG